MQQTFLFLNSSLCKCSRLAVWSQMIFSGKKGASKCLKNIGQSVKQSTRECHS